MTNNKTAFRKITKATILVKFLQKKNEKHFCWAESEREELVNYVLASNTNSPRHSKRVATEHIDYFIAQYRRRSNFTLICEYEFPKDGDDFGFMFEVVNILAYADLLMAVSNEDSKFEDLIVLAEKALCRGLD